MLIYMYLVTLVLIIIIYRVFLHNDDDAQETRSKPAGRREDALSIRQLLQENDILQESRPVAEINDRENMRNTHPLLLNTEDTSDELPDERAKETFDTVLDDSPNDNSGEKADNPESADDLNEENIFNSFVNKENLLEEIKTHRTLHGMIRYIEANIKRWQMQTVKVAITGHSGAGKSSLINALRGIKPSEKDAAAVGITETTFEPKEYKYPNNNKVVLVDLPGMGTLKFPREQYLEVIKYKQFDVFIIVFTERVSENEIWLAGKLEEHKKHVMLVRTKIDIDLMNEQRDYPKGFDKKRKLKTLRQDIQENLKRGNMALKANIFLISSANRELYDFKELDQMLRKLLNKKGIIICKMIHRAVTEEIYSKRRTCKTDFLLRTVGATLYEFLPANVDRHLTNTSISRIHEICLYRFCLDKDSLNVIEKENKSLLRRLNVSKLSSERFVLVRRFYAWENPFRILFGFYNYFRSYMHMHNSIQTMSNDFAECELQLVSERLQQLQTQLKPL